MRKVLLVLMLMDRAKIYPMPRNQRGRGMRTRLLYPTHDSWEDAWL